MDASLAQKILACAAGRNRVEAGERVRARVDAVVLDERAFARVAERLERGVARPPEHAAGLLLIASEAGRRRDGADARVWRRMRRVAATFGARYVAPGRAGSPVVDAADLGFVRPGGLIVAPDERFGSLGALGALVVVPEDDAALAEAFAGGTVEVEVPEVVRLRLTGRPGRWAGGFDVGAALLASQETGDGGVLELAGPTVDSLDVVERLALGDVLSRAQRRPVLTVPDERTLAWVRARSTVEPKPILPDRRAAGGEREVTVDGVEPMLVPLAGGAACRVTALPDTPIGAVVIGGEIGGRVEDLRIAARLLKEHPVPESVRLYVCPGSPRAQVHALDEGAAARLVRSGAVFGAPSLPVFGLPEGTLAADDERVVVTAAGLEGGVAVGWLASAPVAAASAAMGRVAHPDEVLRSKRKAV